LIVSADRFQTFVMFLVQSR